MDQQRAISIYALVDPRTDTVRYVGKSVNVEHRYRVHCVGRGIRHSAVWVQSLRRVGLRPVLLILETATEHTWEERERYWIAFYRDAGVDLTNLSDGGEGSHGFSPSPEQRKRLSESGLIAQNRPEVKAATRSKTLLRYTNPIERAKASEYSREIGRRPEVIDARRASMQSLLKDPAQLEKFNKNLQAARENPEIEAKRLTNLRVAIAMPESKAKKQASIKAVRSQPESRAKSSVAGAALWADPVWRANMMMARARKKAEREQGERQGELPI